jgi:2-isopropylmalate synthase
MFSPEDWMRTERDFLFEAIEVAIKAWATEINLPDTVWYAQYMEIYTLINDLTNYFKETDFSIHTHNDLWQAVANTLAAVKAGCHIIQWTIPPAYWERAWNADLIQVLMNLQKRLDYYNIETTRFDMTKAYDTVSFISNSIWKRIPDNYPSHHNIG